jgi:hypothetical protein
MVIISIFQKKTWNYLVGKNHINLIMNDVLWIVVFILLLVVVLLSIALVTVIKRATYLSEKDKDFIVFVIDIYIDYAEELKLNTVEEHEIIVKQLERIKENRMKNG